MSSLLSTLSTLETEKSPLEQELRALPLELHPDFLKNKSVVPLLFEKSHTQLRPKMQFDSSHPLHPLVAKQQHLSLSAKPGDFHPEGKRIAVLFSGGPAAGGHNIIAGIKAVLGPNNILYGVKNGPKGLIEGTLEPLDMNTVDRVRNQGGFDLLGSDRTKIKTDKQVAEVKNTVKTFKLDAIIIIGGDDSNTNAAFLAAELAPDCTVVGVPKTIDGDLQVGQLLPISFGFDTATKVYSELVGNLLKDAPSSQKYWHFVKLMGRNASHVTLEVALQTHPHFTFISEAAKANKSTLQDCVRELALCIKKRAELGYPYGLVLIPEGLIEQVPECQQLIGELNTLLSKKPIAYFDTSLEKKLNDLEAELSSNSEHLLLSFPQEIQETLLAPRDSHGNLKVSQIPTETLLIYLTQNYLKKFHPDIPFHPLSHFFGYEGRCSAPTRFDAYFTANLGAIAGSLALREHTGYMASFTQLNEGGCPIALPLMSLLTEEMREGVPTVVIEKSVVELSSPAYQYLKKREGEWSTQALNASPGPIQYWGETARQLPITVALNQGYKSLEYKRLKQGE